MGGHHFVVEMHDGKCYFLQAWVGIWTLHDWLTTTAPLLTQRYGFPGEPVNPLFPRLSADDVARFEFARDQYGLGRALNCTALANDLFGSFESLVRVVGYSPEVLGWQTNEFLIGDVAKRL